MRPEMGGKSYFNPRSRTGSDACFPSQTPEDRHFNPRSRTGSDRKASKSSRGPGNFNPRSRTGSDVARHDEQLVALKISTHAPARGATIRLLFAVAGRDISTHAPARGATWTWSVATPPSRRFQPTLPHGERPTIKRLRSASRTFQPTLPHGERLHGRLRPNVGFDISTHAPARGATGSAAVKPNSYAAFQPTLPHGERHAAKKTIAASGKFQPTLPHGERPADTARKLSSSIFQPTLPHGERLKGFLLVLDGFVISTHAPARGATIA